MFRTRKRHTCSSINCDSILKGNLQTWSLNIERFIFLETGAKTYCPEDISLRILSSFYWVSQKVRLAFSIPAYKIGMKFLANRIEL